MSECLSNLIRIKIKYNRFGLSEYNIYIRFGSKSNILSLNYQNIIHASDSNISDSDYWNIIHCNVIYSSNECLCVWVIWFRSKSSISSSDCQNIIYASELNQNQIYPVQIQNIIDCNICIRFKYIWFRLVLEYNTLSF